MILMDDDASNEGRALGGGVWGVRQTRRWRCHGGEAGGEVDTRGSMREEVGEEVRTSLYFSDRYESDIRQGRDGTYWVLRDAGHIVQVYWYTPSEASNEKKWGLLCLLQCCRCKQERNHARRMQDLECAATLRAWRLRQILLLLDFEEVRILRNILWRWRRLSYGWPLCAAPPADRTL